MQRREVEQLLAETRDPEPAARRRARGIIAAYRRTGRINQL